MQMNTQFSARTTAETCLARRRSTSARGLREKRFVRSHPRMSCGCEKISWWTKKQAWNDMERGWVLILLIIPLILYPIFIQLIFFIRPLCTTTHVHSDIYHPMVAGLRGCLDPQCWKRPHWYLEPPAEGLTEAMFFGNMERTWMELVVYNLFDQKIHSQEMSGHMPWTKDFEHWANLLQQCTTIAMALITDPDNAGTIWGIIEIPKSNQIW